MCVEGRKAVPKAQIVNLRNGYGGLQSMPQVREPKDFAMMSLARCALNRTKTFRLIHCTQSSITNENRYSQHVVCDAPHYYQSVVHDRCNQYSWYLDL